MTITELKADLCSAQDAWHHASRYIPKKSASDASEYQAARNWIERATKAYCRALLAASAT